MYLVCFFFFKQKTAYEMRISDWSSDVCSSDLRRVIRSVEREPDGTWIIAADHLDKAAAFEARQRRDRPVTIETLSAVSLDRLPHTDAATWPDKELVAGAPEPIRDAGFGREVRAAQRSEEHTSELQSLMLTSYAVFCLKKKKQQTYT